MIALLLTAVVEIGFALIVGVILYQILLSGPIKRWLVARRKRHDAFNSANNIAQVKLLSENVKDIEKFIENNATYLSGEIIKKLVARLEYLKADKVVKDDDLKKRVQVMLPVLEKAYEDAVEIESGTRKVRRR